jgi:hypothetical protein
MSGARTLERGLAVLIAVRDAGLPLSVTDIARITDLDRAVIARLLPPLIEEGFLRRDEDPRRYVLGPAMQWSVEGQPAAGQFDEVATTEDHPSWEDRWWHFEDTSETPDTGGRHFTDPLVEDAYLALVSFAGALPLSTVVGHVAAEALTGPLGASATRASSSADSPLNPRRSRRSRNDVP